MMKSTLAAFALAVLAASGVYARQPAEPSNSPKWITLGTHGGPLVIADRSEPGCA